MATTAAVVGWYMRSYRGSPYDVGLPQMFCRPEMVGDFAVDPAALAAGRPEALFRLLVTMTMFQRRSDAQIMRVLRGISQADAHEVTDMATLLRLADEGGCDRAATTASLKDACDLYKTKDTKLGECHYRAGEPCHLKRHTVLLKRYGHFGKVPTSAALMVRGSGAGDMRALYQRAVAAGEDSARVAAHLETTLRQAWRVSDKIAAMFLSAVTNPALSGELAPWADGVDTSRFVVVDSNVDLFLRAIGYDGYWTYDARRAFVQALAAEVDLGQWDGALERYNPRVVQQALYMFMSVSNRRSNPGDCGSGPEPSCASCPKALASICGRRAGVAG